MRLVEYFISVILFLFLEVLLNKILGSKLFQLSNNFMRFSCFSKGGKTRVTTFEMDRMEVIIFFKRNYFKENDFNTFVNSFNAK